MTATWITARFTVKVCGEQRLWVAGRRQVDRHKPSNEAPTSARSNTLLSNVNSRD